MNGIVNRSHTGLGNFVGKAIMPARFIKGKYYVALFVICLLRPGYATFSQSDKALFISWYFPGINYKANSRLEFLGQYGIDPSQHIQAAYMQAFIKTGKYVTINPAYLYLNINVPNKARLQEHTFMNSMIIAFPVHQLVIDDRNMLWNRFRKDEKDLHFYRNRLRITWPFNERLFHLKPCLFDEVTYSITDGEFTRNRLAAGLNCKPARWFQLEVIFLHEHDEYNGKANLLFVMGTVELTRRKNNERKSQQNRCL